MPPSSESPHAGSAVAAGQVPFSTAPGRDPEALLEALEARVQERTRELQGQLADLQRRHEQLRVLLDESSDPIFSFDADGRYRYVNHTFGATLGLPVQQIIGKTIWDIFPGEGGDRRFAVVRQVFERGSMETIEVAVPVPGGVKHMITTVKPIRDPSGQVVSVICISKDVTALKLAQTAAQAASRSKSEFLANMSHEIRTPMNGILGMAQIGYRQSAGRTRSQSVFAHILDSGKLLLTILNDILDFSKIEAGQMAIESVPMDLRRIIETTAFPLLDLAANKSIQLSLKVDPTLPAAVRGDPVRVAQVVLNLLSNALKFTESGAVDITATAQAGEIRIGVRDTGIGLSAEQAERLFSPFQQGDSSTTRRFGGTGLGLTISRQLARLMGGDLQVHSQPGQGSEFVLSLPLVACDPLPDPPEDDTSAGVLTARLPGLRVLVAEDNAVNQLVMQDTLAFEGARVTVVGNGQLAVDLVRREPTAFDLVLMDVQMPVMDGLDATRALKGLAPALPVVGQTAHAMPEERDACLAAGMVATVTKPIDHERLVATVLQHLPGPQATRSAGAGAVPAPRMGQSGGALIDWVQLEHRYRRRPSFIVRLLRLAVTSLAPLSAQLRSAAAARNGPALARIAHTVKGSCGDLLADPVQALAAATEQAALAFDAQSDAAVMAAQLADLVDRLQIEAQAGLATRAAGVSSLTPGS